MSLVSSNSISQLMNCTREEVYRGSRQNPKLLRGALVHLSEDSSCREMDANRTELHKSNDCCLCSSHHDYTAKYTMPEDVPQDRHSSPHFQLVHYSMSGEVGL